jgi:DNA-binding SARP family transcriptional activator
MALGAPAQLKQVPAPAGAPTLALRLILLDGFALHHDGVPIAVPLSCQRLLAFIALHEHPLLRLRVAGTLWRATSDEQAAANLRSALWRVHQLGYPLLQATSASLAVGAQLSVDVRECRARSHRLLDQATPLQTTDVEAPWPAGELLPDWYDEWVIIERERFRQVAFHALETLCERLTAMDRFAQAIHAGLAAIAAEPLRESAHRALIRTYLAEGNQGEALRQYELYRRLLEQDLHLAPSGAMEALIAPLRPR